MKKIVCLTVSLFFLLAFTVDAGEVRTWTSAGKQHTIEADLVNISEDGESVTLRQKDGEETIVQLDTMSQADQEYVAKQKETANQLNEKEANPFTTKKDEKTALPEQPINSRISQESNKTTEIRTWIPANGGKPVKAKLVGVTENGQVTLVTSNGDIGNIPLENFSLADRKYVLAEMEAAFGKQAREDLIRAMAERPKPSVSPPTSGTSPATGSQSQNVNVVVAPQQQLQQQQQNWGGTPYPYPYSSPYPYPYISPPIYRWGPVYYPGRVIPSRPGSVSFLPSTPMVTCPFCHGNGQPCTKCNRSGKIPAR